MESKSSGRVIEKALVNLFVDKLADMYGAEGRNLKALPKLADGASSQEVKEALKTHLKETEGQVALVEQVFAAFELMPITRISKCDIGLPEEGQEIDEECEGFPANDAAIVSTQQRLENYKIASYRCLRDFPSLLSFPRYQISIW